MTEPGGSRVHERWARLRFSVIGQLLAAPPAKVALRAALVQLAAREWRHPSTGAPVRFGVSTLERCFYRARNERHDPVGVLRRKRRGDAGAQASMTSTLRQALLEQYGAHKGWSVQLRHNNLAAQAETRPELRPVPSYTTVRRFLAASGLTRRRATTTRQTDGTLAAAARLEACEVCGFEAEYVNGLWHWDCHHGSRKVLTARGEWRTPILFSVLDDRSRLACHPQWYLAESAETIAHGLSQAMQKRGLPRAVMSDNGSAMTAAEIGEGLARLGIVHQSTLPYSPYQNGKQEVLWASVEGRLMAMLEGVDDLTLGRLNEATQAWVEQDSGAVLCRLFPQDKAANASGLRRGLQPIATEPGKPSSLPSPSPSPSPSRSPPPPVRGIGPLLKRMLDRQAATGLPPAYLPKDEGDDA